MPRSVSLGVRLCRHRGHKNRGDQADSGEIWSLSRSWEDMTSQMEKDVDYTKPW